MDIQNASATPKESNQLWIVNTVRWESWILQLNNGNFYNMKFKVIAFFVIAGMNVTANYFYI